LPTKNGILTLFKHSMMEPEYVAKEEYSRVVAARDLLQGQLDETLELLAHREGQIASLRQQLGRVAQLQSELDNTKYEVGFLQDELEEQKRKVAGQYQLQAELMQELQMGDSRLKQYGSLSEQVESLQKQVMLLRREADEMAALNKELLEDLRQVARLESSLSMEKQENRILKERVAELEKRPVPRPGFMDS
jgi:chromosome segregation ATPase